MSSMEYDLFEILNISITNKIPSIIVEGRDDIQFYSDLSSSIDKEIDVVAIENIDGYSEGCSSLIQAFEDLNAAIANRIEYDLFILGIIDRDSRLFRNEIPSDLKGLFILKFYSFESHFVTPTTIRKLISFITNTSNLLMRSSLAIAIVETELKNKQESLYYCSVEALKNACERDYNGLLGYATKPGTVLKNEVMINNVLSKRDELDEYARNKSISIDDLKLITKGKWLLKWFIGNVLEEIKKLPNFCQNRRIAQCQYCETDKFSQCLYKIKSDLNVTSPMLINYTRQLYDEPELDYIKDRIKQLS